MCGNANKKSIVPRASRTVPFVSKSIGVPLASYASRCMLGETLEQIGFTEEVHVPCEP